MIRILFGKYVGLGTPVSFQNVARVAQSDILRRASLIVEVMQDEANTAITERLGSATEWTPFSLLDVMEALMARTISRVFVGAYLCKNAEWVRYAHHDDTGSPILTYYFPSLIWPGVTQEHW